MDNYENDQNTQERPNPKEAKALSRKRKSSKITDEETKREQLFLTPTMTTESNIILTNGDPLLRPPEDKTFDKLARSSDETAEYLAAFYSIDIHDGTNRMLITFTIPRRYVILRYISSGAQGAVVSAYDQLEKRPVAIKKMHRPCSEARTAKMVFRELCLLMSVDHPNIIRLLDAFTPNRTVDAFEEFYLVMELMDYSLHGVARIKRLNHRELSFIVYQLLCAVNHLHKCDIIHRDLKPENIVINEKGALMKVLDFGLARYVAPNSAVRMSSYVTTRFYRAPEIIFQLPYDLKADVWSIGCIFAELLLHRVLFQGDSSLDQWAKIVGTLGSPKEEFLGLLPPGSAAFLRNLPAVPQSQIVPDTAFVGRQEISPNLTVENCRDLLSRMLCIDPRDRYSVTDCLAHPYVKLWHKPHEVNRCESPKYYDEQLEMQEKTVEEWKGLLFDVIRRFQRSRRFTSPHFSTNVLKSDAS